MHMQSMSALSMITASAGGDYALLSAMPRFGPSRSQMKASPLTDAQRRYLQLSKWDGKQPETTSRQMRRHPDRF